MGITIRRATIADKEAIWAFLRESYGEESPELVPFKFPVRWTWQFIDNPYIPDPKGGELYIWLAFKDGELLGQVGAVPVGFLVGNKPIMSGEGGDLIVSKRARGLGLGKLLLKAYTDEFPLIVHIAVARYSKWVCEQLGSKPLRPASLMWRPMRMDGDFVRRALLRKLSNHKRLKDTARFLCRVLQAHHILAFLANARSAFYKGAASGGRAGASHEIAEVGDFDAELMEFIRKESAGYGVILNRTHELLSWKYIGNPMVEYRIFTAREGGLLSGYIVLRTPHPAELRVGAVADILVARGDSRAASALMRHALAYFGKSVCVVEALVSHDFLRKPMRKLGFYAAHTYVPDYMGNDPQILEQAGARADDWYLTAADQDFDQIRPISEE